MRVLHVITGPLAIGGAELMLGRLIEASQKDEVTHEVVSLTELGIVADRIQELGVRTVALGMPRRRARYPDPVRLTRLVRMIRAQRPDVVQTWLYHADLLGGIAAKLAGGPRIFWGLHNGTIDPVRTRRTTRWTVAACARLSRFIPDRIVSVSSTARDVHVAAGYDPSKFVLIPNGFDLGEYRPDPAGRAELRAELGLSPNAPLLGMAARFDPQKDFENLARAAAILAARRPDVRFLLCGRGTCQGSRELEALLEQHRVRERFVLLGARRDMPRILAALDVATLSSAYGEAFPLFIGEAMACGIPCVVTDLGDCARLVGETGRVVPPRDPEALARAWEAILSLEPDARARLGLAARERVGANYALPRIAERYLGLYREVLEETASAPRPAVPRGWAPSPRDQGADHGPS